MEERRWRVTEAGSVHWTKSSFSAGGDNNCVEVAQLPGGATAVRDSKAVAGPALVVAGPAWRAFLGGARAGAFGA